MSGLRSRAGAFARHLEARFRIVTFAGTLVPTVSALGVQLVAFALTARGLGLEAFGIYTALLAVSALSVELVGLGGADLLVRGVAREPERFASYFGNLLILTGLTLPLVVLGGVWVAHGVMESPLPVLFVALVIGGEILIGRAAASLELVMVAHRQTVRAGAVRFATAFVRLLAAAIFFAALGRSDLEGWIEVAFLQSVITTALYLALSIRLYGRPRAVLLTRDLWTGLSFCLNQASRSSQGSLDRIVLSRFADAASVGIYGAASRVLTLGLFPLQVVTRMTYPNFFVHGGRGGIAASRRYALSVVPVMLGVGLAACGAVSLAGFLAPAVLGRDFESIVGVTAALSFSLPLMALQYPAADALTGAGYQGLRAVLSVTAAFGFGIIMAFGARLDGIEGLVIAFLSCHALFAAVLWTAAFRVRDRPEGREMAPA
ncbi:lipopolysaccharide biosynthesis protein [Aureimonas sp. D3]|uniref:lipopolysaccharide biosynthesis protein n=1 Tax=Aureimonas sp. D3 TaxID=1638164 RepID=UPI00078124CF|nr:oligosaccharide flippase family protein [Aureimonas sp. D3]